MGKFPCITQVFHTLKSLEKFYLQNVQHLEIPLGSTNPRKTWQAMKYLDGIPLFYRYLSVHIPKNLLATQFSRFWNK